MQKILESKQFSRADSLKRFLNYVVEQTLLGRGDKLNEYSLGQDVFGRGEQFDPQIDTIVRVQARNLRTRLDEYYQTEGRNDSIVLKLPRGGYGLVVVTRDSVLPGALAERPKHAAGLKRAFWLSLVVGSVSIGIIFTFIASRARTPAAVKSIPFTTFPGWESEPAFSPDGKQIAFAWNGEGLDNFDIYIKGIGSDVPLRLTTHPGEDRNPVWSPDGQRLAFVRRFRGQDSVYTIPVLGGPERKVHTLTRPLVLCPIGVSCLSWSPDGDSLAIIDKTSPGGAQSVFILSLRTLNLRQVSNPSAAQSWGDISPSFSPDGKSLAFIRWSTASSDVFVTPVGGGEARRVTFEKRACLGVDWLSGGRELVFSTNRVGSRGIWKVAVSGGDPRLVVATTESAVVSAARRMNRLAYANTALGADSNIWRTDLKSPAHPATRLIASTKQEMSPEYSPDGNRIVFDSTRSGSHEIWMCDRDGRNPVQLTDFPEGHAGSPRWSPNGHSIAFDGRPKESSAADIYVIDADERLPRRITNQSSEDIVPCWAEDGRSIYFGSTRSGDWQIWKIAAQGGDAARVTRNGGVMTVGVRNGFVYYLKSMAASIWRVPERGGREEMVLNTPEFHYSRYSALFGRGIYFLDPQLLDPTPRTISFLNFDTGQATRITKMTGKPRVWEPGMSVSPDGRWMLYTQVDEESGDVTLIENLR